MIQTIYIIDYAPTKFVALLQFTAEGVLRVHDVS